MLQLLICPISANHMERENTVMKTARSKSGDLAMVLDLCTKTHSTTNNIASIVKPFTKLLSFIHNFKLAI